MLYIRSPLQYSLFKCLIIYSDEETEIYTQRPLEKRIASRAILLRIVLQVPVFILGAKVSTIEGGRSQKNTPASFQAYSLF